MTSADFCLFAVAKSFFHDFCVLFRRLPYVKQRFRCYLDSWRARPLGLPGLRKCNRRRLLWRFRSQILDFRQISLGKAMILSLTQSPYLHDTVRLGIGTSSSFGDSPLCHASYTVSVRGFERLLAASFSLHLAMKTLLFALSLPRAGRIGGVIPLDS